LSSRTCRFDSGFGYWAGFLIEKSGFSFSHNCPMWL
jgi:hypothetical protein